MKWEDVIPKRGNNDDFISAVICYNDGSNVQHSILDQYIIPYRKELVGANNAVLFIDNEGTILGGQAGRYDPEEGLHVVFFGNGKVESEDEDT